MQVGEALDGIRKGLLVNLGILGAEVAGATLSNPEPVLSVRTR